MGNDRKKRGGRKKKKKKKNEETDTSENIYTRYLPGTYEDQAKTQTTHQNESDK